MHPLAKHESFECEVLDKMQKGGFLRPLVFGGGTMLRLCHDLPRYSVDLDFWFCRRVSYEKYHEKLKLWLKNLYEITDSKNKHYTLLYELRKKGFERKLKLEIRKEMIKKGVEEKIAFSPHATGQVLLQTLSLQETIKRKLAAIGSRHEIRDYYDLEFLLRKGVEVRLNEQSRQALHDGLQLFRKTDYSVTLGSLLDEDLRNYHTEHGLSYLSTFVLDTNKVKKLR